METINQKICEVSKFLRDNEISYNYIDYKQVKGDTFRVLVVLNFLGTYSMRLISNHPDIPIIRPYTNHHFIIEFEYEY